MKKVRSWDNKIFDGYTSVLTVRIKPSIHDQLKLWSIRSKRDKSVFVRCAIEEKLQREVAKEKIGLYPLERRLGP
ncbi:hypothetical protein A3K80_08015 [Candidatus Bathyarchaeota archaeon RBG_13_38_9]|nr:MAG: hypothetical protein A3K80_08015 [Candidatus Bathyarchaeota archaeon RBG_13_38_9]